MECHRVSPRIQCTYVHAVGDCVSERIPYKRSSADLAIEVEEDNVRFLSLEPETSMLGIQYGTGLWCAQECEASAHCVFLVVIIISQMATVDNL